MHSVLAFIFSILLNIIIWLFPFCHLLVYDVVMVMLVLNNIIDLMP